MRIQQIPLEKCCKKLILENIHITEISWTDYRFSQDKYKQNSLFTLALGNYTVNKHLLYVPSAAQNLECMKFAVPPPFALHGHTNCIALYCHISHVLDSAVKFLTVPQNSKIKTEIIQFSSVILCVCTTSKANSLLYTQAYNF